MKSEYIVVNLNTTQFTTRLFTLINKSKQDKGSEVIYRIKDKIIQVSMLFGESKYNSHYQDLLYECIGYLEGTVTKKTIIPRDGSYARYDAIGKLDQIFNSVHFLKIGDNLKQLIENFVNASEACGNYDNNFCPIHTGIILILYESILDVALEFHSHLNSQHKRPSDDYLEELMYFLELKLEPVVILRPTVIDVPSTSPNQIKLELTR